MRENTDQNNSEYGHYLRSGFFGENDLNKSTLLKNKRKKKQAGY